jgi:hypothetical protein
MLIPRSPYLDLQTQAASGTRERAQVSTYIRSTDAID